MTLSSVFLLFREHWTTAFCSQDRPCRMRFRILLISYRMTDKLSASCFPLRKQLRCTKAELIFIMELDSSVRSLVQKRLLNRSMDSSDIDRVQRFQTAIRSKLPRMKDLKAGISERM